MTQLNISTLRVKMIRMDNERKRIVPFPLRLPPELRAEIEKSARDNTRSLNAEILHILSSRFDVEQHIIDTLNSGNTEATNTIKSAMAELLDDLLLEKGLTLKNK